MIIEESELMHYGVIRRSGRYPWGSGGNEDQHNKILLDYISEMKSAGMTEAKIAEALGMTTTALRAEKSIARNQQRASNVALAQRLKDKGMGYTAIGERMNMPESTIRGLLAPSTKEKEDILLTTSEMLKAEVDKHEIIDVGRGVELGIPIGASHVGVSETRLKTATHMLWMQGYETHTFKVPQQTNPGKNTTVKVICKPGMTQKEAWQRSINGEAHFITSYSEDGGRSFVTKFRKPIAINPKRLEINYAEDGGSKADGVVYVRPGIKDLDMKGNLYGQVRIQVGKDRYIKGMALLKDDLPDGVDLVFNTNKTKAEFPNKLDVLKKIDEKNPELPFGSIVHQIGDRLDQPDGKVTSAMNMVYEKGDWEKWSRTLSSQMLSKQNRTLARQQLDMTYEHRQNLHESLKTLTNPVVRKRLLEDFASGTDAAAVHLKAASLPQQAVHVLLPLSNIKPTEVYARGYENGTRVVLIRHPHGGPFEIPDLVVNNKNAEGRKLLGDSRDAIGIHHLVAERLSGADFDGDTVLVIPDNNRRITIQPALKDLKDFDPKNAYPKIEGMKVMSNTQTQMGMISNLITDMALQGAPDNEMARAVKHSMVVIDAEKHELNHRLSANENGIKELKKKYQSGGASTLISRKRAELRVPERKPRLQKNGGPVNKQTGALEWEPTNRVYGKTGKPAQSILTKLGETSDAHTLSSGTPMEIMYANHSNKLKALANQARLDALNTPLQNKAPLLRRRTPKKGRPFKQSSPVPKVMHPLKGRHS